MQAMTDIDPGYLLILPVARQRGFTLIELLVTIALMAIIASIAYPSFQRTISQQRSLAAATELRSLFTQARTQAVLVRRPATLTASNSLRTWDLSYPSGATTIAFQKYTAPAAVSISSSLTNNPTLVFQPNGRVTDASGNAITSSVFFRLCPTSADANVSGVTLTLDVRGNVMQRTGPLVTSDSSTPSVGTASC